MKRIVLVIAVLALATGAVLVGIRIRRSRNASPSAEKTRRQPDDAAMSAANANDDPPLPAVIPGIPDATPGPTPTPSESPGTANRTEVTHQPATMDFDGDGKSDYAVARNVNGSWTWYLLRSSLGFTAITWGSAPGDIFVPGDYDGDHKWDVAVWRSNYQEGGPGYFYVLQSASNTLLSAQFGTYHDNPRLTQDFDGDGKADFAVTRDDASGQKTWYIQRTTLGFTAILYGLFTDSPVRGDFDGDGKADVTVYRPYGGIPSETFIVRRSSDGGLQARHLGQSLTDFIVPGDYDGDGKTDYAMWRGYQSDAVGAGNWYWMSSSDGFPHALPFGLADVDVPVPGDYDGDGKTDQAVWRKGPPGVFYVYRSTGGMTTQPFGSNQDVAVVFALDSY